MLLIGNLGYLAATALFVGGMVYMGNPKKAARGNGLLILGMLAAIVSTLILNASYSFDVPWRKLALIFGLLAVGIFAGRQISFGFKITKMPELISLFNGFGGLCAALIALVAILTAQATYTGLTQLLLVSTLFLGFVTFSGSIIAFLKLGGKLKKNRLNNSVFMWSSLLACLFLISISILNTDLIGITTTLILLSIFSLANGIFFANGVGGGDMPVLISVLNGLTGVLTAISGVYFENTIMVLLGVFVGATGIILTVQMSKAMNKSVSKVFFGSSKPTKMVKGEEQILEIKETSSSQIVSELRVARKVAIVPGYGLAIAQAQKMCLELKQQLNGFDIELKFLIHPVAGRMPGHMNVLLAEANIPYDDIIDLEKGNEYLAETDICFVIGANDVVNISAENNENSPIYGMPIIQTYKAQKVVVIKRSLSTGYADIQNPLFGEENCNMFFSDAKVGLEEIVEQLKLY